MKKLVLVTAATAAAVAVFVSLTIQPRRLTLATSADGTIPGVIHIHTNRSDGLSAPDEIAAAAARAGLKFIVFTDHGDATRKPDPPEYRSGVLCLDGVEVSTTGGHYIALDIPAAPYPLGGEARDVVEDIQRLGGFGIVAHPDSPKPELQWRDWSAPFDGIEIVNPDTSWRVWAGQPGWKPKLKLLEALIAYPFRSAETIAGLLREGSQVSSRWGDLAQNRRVVTLAGADAHAKLALNNADPGDSRFALSLPGYEASFRVLSVRVRPGQPLSGNAAEDAGAVMRAIRSGHVYTAIDALATPPSLEFTASNASGAAQQGDELKAGSPVTLRVRTNAPSSFTTTVYDGIQSVSTDHHAPDFTLTMPDKPAVYWVQVRASGRSPDVPWVTSNAIYVRGPEPPARPAARLPAKASQTLFTGKSAEGWRVEQDQTSVAAVDLAPIFTGGELRFRFGLSTHLTPAPFVALAVDTPRGLQGNDRLTFTLRAEHPMRISVQLRSSREGEAPERWQRTVFVSEEAEERTVFFDDFTPVGTTRTLKAPLETVRNVMFVIDPTNTKRGTSSRIWLRQAAVER